MKSILYITLLIGCVIWTSSCSSENNKEIEIELQAHFNDFIAEANEHGLTISLDELDVGGYIENIETRGTLGQCKSYSDGSKQVVIDEPYWSRASTMEKEYLVFHELGHCVLEREHDDTKDESGTCLSIMQSGDGACKGIYESENREALLEELFGK